MYYINIMSDSDEPDISATVKNDTPISEEIPNSPKEVEDVIESEDELEGDNIPVIEGEEFDDELQEEKEDIIDDNIEVQTINLKEFNTDFNPDDLLLLILLDNDKYVDYLGIITDITDDYIVLNDERNIYYTEGFIQLIHKDYSIFDIIKIQEVSYDILEKDEVFKEDKIELELVEKTKKEKIYTDTEKTEDFISSIINLYDIYDNEKLIKDITENSYLFIDLIKKSKDISEIDNTDYLKFIKDLIKTNELNIPSFILPIVGMKKKIFNSDLPESSDTINTTIEEELVRKYNILNETDDFSSKGYINYMNNLLSDEFSSYINDLNKYGIHISISKNVIRDCFDDMNPCNSVSGRYSIDLLKIRDELDIIHNKEKEIIVEKRNINMIGFLFIPIEYINEIYNLDLYNPIYNLNDIINFCNNKNLKNILKSVTINNININNDTTRVEEYEQNFYKYLFDINKNITYSEFKDILIKNFPSNTDIINSLNYIIDEDKGLYLYNLFYNYDDIEKILNLLNISIKDINYTKKQELNKVVNNNITEYIKIYNDLLKKYIKKIKPLKKITKELDLNEKIKLCQELIFSQKDLIYQYYLIQKFISIYGREADEYEDKSFYYNKSVKSEKLICKHYLYLIKGDKNSFETLKSVYGVPCKDGNIYCKKCNRFICYDDFSTFEGFQEGVPTTSKEATKDIEDIINLEDKQIKSSYEFIKYISEKFNINIHNDDMIKIINLYILLNQSDLYNIRYETDNILKSHPSLKSKENKKTSKELNEYLCIINNILSAIFLIFIQIQLSNNSYNINFNNRINLINSDDSWKVINVSDNEECINIKVITYIESKFKSLVKKYPKEKTFNYIHELFNEFEVYKEMKFSFKRHFINVIRYWLNPQYNLYTQLDKYFLFESGINKGYIKDSWITYKPLSDNKLIKQINNIVQSNNDLYIKYFVNNNSLQNISLLKSINNDELKYKEFDIKLSELMNNSSFKRLYIYALKAYGKSPVLPILNLLSSEFLKTFTSSHKKELILLLNKCNFNHENEQYSSINYKLIKNVFLDEIIQLDIKKDSDNILKFIHINNYNHEYFLLNSNVIRYYSYNPPKVYITDSFDELLEKNESILTKMFKYYCLDKNDKLIPNRVKEVDGVLINTNIINYLLLDFNEGLIDDITDCVKELPMTNEYFHIILNYLIEKNKMKLPNQFIPYTENYTNQYIINYIYKNTLIETRLLEFFDDYLDSEETIYDKFKNIFDLLELIIYKKDNNDMVDISEISNQFDIILRNIISYKKDFIENTDKLFNKIIENDMYLQFNELQKDRIGFKLNKKEQTNLERDINFKPETNIPYLINNIINKLENKNICDKMINNIFYYLSFLKNTPNGNFNPIVHKNEWKMSDSKIEYIYEYLSINTFLLHNEIFMRNKMKDFEQNNKYAGFNEYRKNDYYIFFDSLYNYINKYRYNIDKLKTDDAIFKESQIKLLNKFIFLFIINKIVEYIQNLLDDSSKEYMEMKKMCDLIENVDITVENCIIILSRFLLDILLNIYEKINDLNWIYIDKETYRNKLDEHNAREKQFNLDKLDHMTDDKRRLYVANQQIKSGITYKESEKENLKRMMDGDRDQQIIEERIELNKALFDESENLVDSVDDVVLQDQNQDDIDPGEDEGYYGTNDFAADGEENEDNLDALQLNED